MNNTVGSHHSTFPPVTHPQAAAKPAATTAGSTAHPSTEAAAGAAPTGGASSMTSLPSGLVGHHVDTTA